MWDGRAFAARLQFARDPWDVLGEVALHWYGRTIPSARVDGGTFSDRFQKYLAVVSACPHLAVGNGALLVKLRDDPSGEYLEFLVETQGAWRIGLRALELPLPDPPVYLRGQDGEWRELNSRFSQFTLQWALYGTRFQSKFFASGGAPGRSVMTAVPYAPLPFPTWRPLRAEHHLFAGADVLLHLDRDDALGDHVWVAARTKDALEQAMEVVACDWDSFS